MLFQKAYQKHSYFKYASADEHTLTEEGKFKETLKAAHL